MLTPRGQRCCSELLELAAARTCMAAQLVWHHGVSMDFLLVKGRHAVIGPWWPEKQRVYIPSLTHKERGACPSYVTCVT